MRFVPVLLGSLLLMGFCSVALAASPRALELRQAQGLTEFTPGAKFLGANFMAEEMNPQFIFGTVKKFAASRKCPITWLMEQDVKDRTNPDREYAVYLEEDCPGRVVYYVFIDQSNMTPQQWVEWRRRFHKSKTEPEYGAAKDKLEQACKQGCLVGAELRFIQVNGELLNVSPEEYLLKTLHFAPFYDLNLQKKLSP